MSKPYVFLDTQIESLNQLGELYSSNFSDAIADVFDNTKKFLKLVKKLGGKDLAKACASEIVSCKYKNNAVTFIIHLLCDDKRVVINGNTASFKDFVQMLRTCLVENEALFAFMEDYGLTKTYAKEEIDDKFSADAYYLERSCNEGFTYKYLSEYYSYGYTESLKTKISNVFIYSEEQFRRALKIVSQEAFQLQLAHIVGFKPVYKMRKEENPLFDTLKLLKIDKLDDFSDNDLIDCVTEGTFYWWLLENFENYDYKKEAKAIYKEFLIEKKINETEYDEYDFNGKIDMSERLFKLYNKFVALFKQGFITVKKNLNAEEYNLDKPYCDTFVASDYMRKNPIKLEADEEKNTEETANTEIDIDIERDLSPKLLKKQRKLINALNRFSGMAVFLSFISIIAAVGAFVYPLFDKSAGEKTSVITLVFTVVLAIILWISSVVMKVSVGKTDKALNEYLFIKCSELNEDNRTPIQEQRYNELVKNKEHIKLRCMQSNRFSSACLALLLGMLTAFGFISVVALLDMLGVLKDVWQKNFVDSLPLKFVILGPVFGLVFGLLKKKKGALAALLIFIIAAVGVVAFALL